MTDDELREHLGEFVICSSKACTYSSRPSRLGRLVERSGRLVLLYPGEAVRKHNVWWLSRANKPKAQGYEEQTKTIIDGHEWSGGFEGEPGERRTAQQVIPLTDRVRCPNCRDHYVVSLPHLRPHELSA